MRLGCCVNMFSDASDPIGRKYLAPMAELGYDYVELPLAQVMDLTDTEFRSLLEELERLSLPCECCNNFFPPLIRLTGEHAVSAGILEMYVEKALGRAAALGAKKVIFGSSGAKNIPPGYPYEKAYGQVVEVLRQVAEIAKQKGICIGIEHLNHTEGNLIRTVEESSQLMQDVHSPQIRLMLDYYHFRMENEKLEILDGLLKDVIHVHLASMEGRTFPKEADRGIITYLAERGYDGGVSIEAYSQDPCADLAHGREVLFPESIR